MLGAQCWAADPVIERFNAEKIRIAEVYKTKTHQCNQASAAKQTAQATECNKAAAQERKLALQAASKERNIGFDCRHTCGYIREITQTATSPASWKVTYMLYDGVVGAIEYLQHASWWQVGAAISLQTTPQGKVLVGR